VRATTSVAVQSYLAAQLCHRPSCSLMSAKCAMIAIGSMPDNVAQLLEGWLSSGGEAGRRTRCSGNNSLVTVTTGFAHVPPVPVTLAKRIRLRICSAQLGTFLWMQITVLHYSTPTYHHGLYHRIWQRQQWSPSGHHQRPGPSVVPLRDW
jgi:hypothetical protein